MAETCRSHLARGILQGAHCRHLRELVELKPSATSGPFQVGQQRFPDCVQAVIRRDTSVRECVPKAALAVAATGT